MSYFQEKFYERPVIPADRELVEEHAGTVNHFKCI